VQDGSEARQGRPSPELLLRSRSFGQVLSKAISCRALARRRKSPTSATIVTAITKAGNALARRVLIEGTWTYRMTAPVSRKLHDSLEPLSAAIRDIAWKAQVRLCARYRRLAASGKPKVVVTTATAREMADFIWAIAQRCALPEAGPRWEILRPVMSRSPDRSSSLE
jgi:hypothetical protein